ncbi:hypothetical protein [Streptomyces sp. NPDC004783]|uniref:hypothetical protein n=1 Tax=unclassified Streptomyces TaxID=2593676 RepID=UPI0033A617EB
MKSLKTAAVVAGSVVIAGFAAPAFALSADDVSRAGLSGVTDTLAQGSGGDVPLQEQTEKLGLSKKGSVGQTLQSSTNGLQNSGSLLGGLGVR